MKRRFLALFLVTTLGLFATACEDTGDEDIVDTGDGVTTTTLTDGAGDIGGDMGDTDTTLAPGG